MTQPKLTLVRSKPLALYLTQKSIVKEMHCSYSEGQSLTWHDSLVIFAPQASSLAGVLSSDRIHLAERVRTPASENANQYRQVTPPARVGYERVDDRKGKYLLGEGKVS